MIKSESQSLSCSSSALTWRRGVSARDREAGGHWEILLKSSSTSSWCKVSSDLPGNCRATTMALVLSARNMRCRHRSKAWLTSCLALDTPHGAWNVKKVMVKYPSRSCKQVVDNWWLAGQNFSPPPKITGRWIWKSDLTAKLQQASLPK